MMRSKSRYLDETVDKVIGNYVREERKVFAVSIRDGKVVYSGNKSFLDYVLSENLKTLRLDNILSKMMDEDDSSDAAKSFSSEILPVFPLLKFKFKSKDWNHKRAYEYLKRVMNVLGFYNGSKKNYGEEEHKPQAWPDTLSWTDFKHPCASSLDKMNTIIEAVLSYYGVDVNTHMTQDHPGPDPAAAVTEEEPAAGQAVAVEEEPAATNPPGPAADEGAHNSSNQDDLFNQQENLNNNNIVSSKDNLQEEDDEDSDVDDDVVDKLEDEREDGELDEESDPNPEQVDEPEHGDDMCPALLRRKRNIEEREAMWQEMIAAKDVVAPPPKPAAKKKKVHKQPKVNSDYGLRSKK